MSGWKQITWALFMVGLVGGMYRLRDQRLASAGAPSEVSARVVWCADEPTGKTWANLGPAGSIEPTDDVGPDGKPVKVLKLVLDGPGYRNCGLNWKGWHPSDACDDVTQHTALTFHIKQTTTHADADLAVMLVDNIKRTGNEPAGNVIHLVGDGALPKIDGEWRKVVIPLTKFTQNKPLQLDKLWEIDFAADTKANVSFRIDRIGFTCDAAREPRFPAGPGYAASALVNTSVLGLPISEGIYGTCGLPPAKRAELGIPMTRWGGNPASRYNWKLGTDNGAHDWFYKNRGGNPKSDADAGWLTHFQENVAHQAGSYLTVPMLGWVAKDHTSYAYSVKKYGPQQASEPGHEDVGNGMLTTGKRITDNDPKDTSLAVSPEFMSEGVRVVVGKAGPASGTFGKGARYWVLDNEPMLWHETHRDVRHEPLGYDELWERTVKYAEAIRAADPTAKIAGFCSWGWNDLFHSAKDEGGNGYASCPDRKAHGDMPLAAWFIAKCGEYRRVNGKPLIDTFDFHWYPQAEVQGKSPYAGKGMDPKLNDLRLRTVRDLWDTSYTQESWIRNTNPEPTAVLRRVRAWIEKYNPGMQLCVGEYNFGGADNITGALAQADLFGVFAREKVDLAFLWHTPEGKQHLAWELFRNYDGMQSRFGDRYLPCATNHEALGIHAARRTSDGALTVMLLNRNLGGACDCRLDIGTVKKGMTLHQLDQDGILRTVPLPEPDASGKLRLLLPPASASMLTVK